MSEELEGGPAFPRPDTTWNPTADLVGAQGHPGMTLRDWFAGQTIAGLLASGALYTTSGKPAVTEDFAQGSYIMADAMLVEREKPHKSEDQWDAWADEMRKKSENPNTQESENRNHG